jgi:hypothetical protein
VSDLQKSALIHSIRTVYEVLSYSVISQFESFSYKIYNTAAQEVLLTFFFDMYMSYRLLISCDLGNLAHFSRTECNIDVTPETLTATDTCIGYYVTRFVASQNVILHTRYVSTCVGAVCGMGRGTKIKTKANRCGACYYIIMLDAHRVTSINVKKYNRYA